MKHLRDEMASRQALLGQISKVYEQSNSSEGRKSNERAQMITADLDPQLKVSRFRVSCNQSMSGEMGMLISERSVSELCFLHGFAMLRRARAMRPAILFGIHFYRRAVWSRIHDGDLYKTAAEIVISCCSIPIIAALKVIEFMHLTIPSRSIPRVLSQPPWHVPSLLAGYSTPCRRHRVRLPHLSRQLDRNSSLTVAAPLGCIPDLKS